jgi:aspartate racemase
MVSRPDTPDRTAYLLGEISDSPLPALLGMAQELAGAGCSVLAMPCVTAHCFYEQIVSECSAPDGAHLINMPFETARYLAERGVKKAGVLATDGTLKTHIFQDALEREGIGCMVPDSAHQHDLMEIIYGQIKAGNPADMTRFDGICRALSASGCDAIILGCTELSLIKRDEDLGGGFLDVIDVLAYCAVKACGAEARDQELITVPS